MEGRRSKEAKSVMNIYQEDAEVTTPSSKRGVSFKSTTKSGRKPLTPYNHQQTPMNYLRKSLKDSSNGKQQQQRKAEMSLASTEKENQTTVSSASKLRRSLRATFSPPLKTSTNTATTTKVSTTTMLTMQAKPQGSKLLGGRRLGGGASMTSLGPPQRAVPKTPNSLLRTELGDDSYEESFLVSPPGAVWNQLNTSSTGLVIVSPQASAIIHSTIKKSPREETASSPPLEPRTLLTSPDPKIVAAAPQPFFSLEPKAISSKPSLQADRQKQSIATAPLEASKPTIQTASPRQIVAPRAKTIIDIQTKTVETSSYLSQNSLATSQVQGVKSRLARVKSDSSNASTYSTQSLAENIARESQPIKPWQRKSGLTEGSIRMLTLPVPAAPEPDEQTRGKVLCMDLSNMFLDTTNKQPPKAILNFKKPMKETRKEERPSTATSESTRSLNEATVSKSRSIQPRPKKSALGNGPMRMRSAPNEQTRGHGVSMDVSNVFMDTTNMPTTNKQPQKYILHQKKPWHKQARKEAFLLPSDKSLSTRTTDEITPIQRGNAIAFDIPAAQRIKVTPAPPKAVRAATPTQIILNPQATWADKQCVTFVSWLNYTFNPTEDDDHEKSVVGSSQPSRSAGLRTLLLHRRMAQARMRATGIYRGEDMNKVRAIIHAEIVKGRLSIREDRDLHADLSLRKQITTLLLSYTTPWLRLALEVVFGEVIVPETPNQLASPTAKKRSKDPVIPVSRMRSILKSFIVNCVLSDSVVLAKYTRGRCKVPSGKFEIQYRQEMRVLVLYRLMILLIFLDRAKEAHILDKVPRLFTKGSAVKSSRAALQVFCRDFLSAEGDFIKHLNRIGIRVSYEQKPVDELEYDVTNLAVDLRDGVRLTRMTEILTGAPTKTLMTSLRLPAVSRLQKLHNVGVTISTLKDFGVAITNDVNSHHIVDGHREMVLKLMWAVISHSCMKTLLQGNQVKEEIRNVRRSNRARRRMEGLFALSPKGAINEHFPTYESTEEVLKSLLFGWCQAVCSCFGMHLADFTTSFADGKALCYLIHYYHPSAIRLEEILPTSSDEAADLSPQQALANERTNSAMAGSRVSELGGIPKMLPITDTENPPDEKSMLLCLSYLCSRLMESSKEIFASILIQACYRKYHRAVLLEKKKVAALFIFQTWCLRKEAYYRARERRYTAAVEVLEHFFTTHKHSLTRLRHKRLTKEHRHFSAIEIQRRFRGLLGRSRFFQKWEELQAACVIRSYWKHCLAKNELATCVEERDAACTIQRLFRGYICRLDYACMVQSIVDLQGVARGFLTRKELQRCNVAAAVIQRAWWGIVAYWERDEAALLIQARWRSVCARQEFEMRLLHSDSACAIQRMWRGYFDRLIFEITVQSAIAIQKIARGHQGRNNSSVKKSRNAAIIIQNAWRGFAAQIQCQLDLLDIITVQSIARCKSAMNQIKLRHRAVEILQRSFRSATARRTLQQKVEAWETAYRENAAATLCQTTIRKLLAKRELLKRKTIFVAAATIQTSWRRMKQQSAFTGLLVAAISVQAMHRGFMVRNKIRTRHAAARVIQMEWLSHSWFLLQMASATKIQSIWRSYVKWNAFKATVQAAILVQKNWRRADARYLFQKNLFAVTILQCAWRKYSAQLNYQLDLIEIVLVQSVVRRRQAMKEASNRKRAVHAIQMATRLFQANHRLKGLKYRKIERETQRRSVLICQALARRYLAQNFHQKSTQSAVKIQACWRLASNHGQYRAMRIGFTLLQGQARGELVRHQLAQLGEKATVIQSHWRGFSASVSYSSIQAAALLCQSLIRRQLADREVTHRKNSLLIIQEAARYWSARRIANRLRLKLDKVLREQVSATTIQTTFRAQTARRQYTMLRTQATKIQSDWRCFSTFIKYNLVLCDILIVQSAVRRRIADRVCAGKKRAVQTIQLAGRRWAAYRRVKRIRTTRDEEARQESAALTVQSFYRGRFARELLLNLHLQATTIQRTFRGHVANISYQMDLVDIIISQSVVRGSIAWNKFCRQKSASIKIQSVLRGWAASRRALYLRSLKERGHLEWQSSVTIQRLWRGRVARIAFKEHSAVRKIQKTWRCFNVHVDYIIKLLAVISIQSYARRFLDERSFRIATEGTMALQALARGCAARRRLRTNDHAAIVLQSAARTYVAKSRFIHHKNAATVIQRVTRGYLARVDLDVANFAACEIQRVWRGYAGFADFVIFVIAIIKIQSVLRMQMAKLTLRERKLTAWVEAVHVNRQAKTIQSAFRDFLLWRRLSQATRTIQRAVRAYLFIRRAGKITRGVKRLQAVVRAHMLRRNRPKKVLIAVRRIDKANARAVEDPKMRLGYRTESALKVLLTSTRLSEIMFAVTTLEAATRLSIVCCEEFTRAGAADILLALIRTCNRSLPHVELLHRILLTLENVASHESLLPGFLNPVSAEVFMDLVQMFRDKDGIFCLSIFLLNRAIICDESVKELCSTRENLKRLKGVYALSWRKMRSSSSVKPPAEAKTNSMKRRELFDLRLGVKNLHNIVSLFETVDTVPASKSTTKHFKF